MVQEMEEKKKPDNKKDKKKDSKLKKVLLIVVPILLAIVLGLGIAYAILGNKDEKEEYKLPEDVLSYDQLLQELDQDKIERIEMHVGSTSIKVKLREEDKVKAAIIPSTQAFVELVQEKILEDNSDLLLVQKDTSPVLSIFTKLFSFIPTLLLIALFLLMFKMQGLGEKGKVYDAETTETKVTFDDVAGLDEEKQEMIEIVDFLKSPEKFYEMGAKVPRGVLLCGNPGTGKTLIAKAIAGQADVPFISISGSEFIEMFAGLGASRVRKLFEKAKKLAPCIIFIDEIDAIGARRTSDSGAETENNQTLNQLLVEMDGFDSEETIIVLAATNRPEMLDKALLRPGRFDRQIAIGLPDINGREEILKIHAKGKKFAEEVSLRSIAEDTAGFTGAELANILNEAAIVATIKKHKEIKQEDVEEAVKKVTVGLEKHNRVISEKDKRVTAYHEAGHAIVSSTLETQKDIKEVSIIPRGLAGGYTMYKTNEDKCYITKTEMEEKLISLLGGRAAEKIIFNDISTGASNDIEVATDIAKKMITVYGMGETLGPISVHTEKDPYELQMLGDKFTDAIGAEIKVLLDTAYVQAQEILRNNREKLDLVAGTILEKEVITAEEFARLMQE